MQIGACVASEGSRKSKERGLGHMENLQMGERSLALRQQGGHWDPRAFRELVSYVSSLGKPKLGMECSSGGQGLECHLLHPPGDLGVSRATTQSNTPPSPSFFSLLSPNSRTLVGLFVFLPSSQSELGHILIHLCTLSTFAQCLAHSGYLINVC